MAKFEQREKITKEEVLTLKRTSSSKLKKVIQFKTEIDSVDEKPREKKNNRKFYNSYSDCNCGSASRSSGVDGTTLKEWQNKPSLQW